MENKKENLKTLRHSAEHILTQAMESLYPKILKAMGPATEDGFYFDFDPKDHKISEEDFEKIEKEMQKIIKENLPITRKEISIEEAREIFKDNPYKQEWIDEIEVKSEKPIIYWTGNNFVDLCEGPHIKSTGEIKAFKLLSIAGAYWHGNEKNKMLTRIYGTAFESKKELEEYLKNLEEAKKRDHRKIGALLGLFFIDETAPGMPYWLPKGTIIYNQLLKFWREEHSKRGYLETITPLINKKQLYEKSGHWDYYRQNMFISDMKDDGTYCLKPMNCPNAMTIFQFSSHSYRDLPLRISDCDTLHRFEKSGQMTGLLRVRKFAQDDAHIFISEDQIESEYRNIFEILQLFYGVFDIKFRIRLGTSPADFIGDMKTWRKAENYLKKIIEKSGLDYFIGEGEGAFYGPKLDILMKDFMGREWQTGTIQLDFQMPKRFNLKYIDKDGTEKTPVVIHRVIYGSLERFIGILIEHFAGAFPVWLSPVQVQIIPISEKHFDYAKKLEQRFNLANIRVQFDSRNETMQAKIRDAQIQKIPYMVIVGDRELKEKTISVRFRDGKNINNVNVKEFTRNVDNIIKNRSLSIWN